MIHKLFFAALFLLSFQAPPRSIYDFVVPGLQGEKFTVATKGKKVLIVVFGTNTQNVLRLRMIDSLQANEPVAFQVIALPVLDLEQPGSVSDIRKILQQVKPRFPVAKPVSFVHEAGEEQHKLLQWLTQKDQNHHFEQKLQDGQMYLVNEFGVLFATMGANTPPHAIKKLLDIQLKF